MQREKGLFNLSCILFVFILFLYTPSLLLLEWMEITPVTKLLFLCQTRANVGLLIDSLSNKQYIVVKSKNSVWNLLNYLGNKLFLNYTLFNIFIGHKKQVILFYKKRINGFLT